MEPESTLMSQTPVPTFCPPQNLSAWTSVSVESSTLSDNSYSDVSVYGSRSVEGSMYKDRDGWEGREQESQASERRKEERLTGQAF